MKRNKNKKAAFAEDKKEFTRYMRTYCEMQLGAGHPMSYQTHIWWDYQYDAIENDYNKGHEKEKRVPLFKRMSILRIEKVGDAWYDTQEWTPEFHGVMGKVIMHA